MEEDSGGDIEEYSVVTHMYESFHNETHYLVC